MSLRFSKMSIKVLIGNKLFETNAFFFPRMGCQSNWSSWCWHYWNYFQAFEVFREFHTVSLHILLLWQFWQLLRLCGGNDVNRQYGHDSDSDFKPIMPEKIIIYIHTQCTLIYTTAGTIPIQALRFQCIWCWPCAAAVRWAPDRPTNVSCYISWETQTFNCTQTDFCFSSQLYDSFPQLLWNLVQHVIIIEVRGAGISESCWRLNIYIHIFCYIVMLLIVTAFGLALLCPLSAPIHHLGSITLVLFIILWCLNGIFGMSGGQRSPV